MRVSTASMSLQWLAQMGRQQTALARTQRQLASGRRIETAADDPEGAAQISLLQNRLGRLGIYGGNIETARRRLSLEEDVLGQVTGVLDRVRELLIRAGGGAQDETSREALAAEARELRTTLIDLANSQDGEGHYLFAGNLSGNRPFEPSGSGVFYGGDQGVRYQQIAETRTVRESDSGEEVFRRIRTGNGQVQAATGASNQGTGIISAVNLTDPGQVTSPPYTFTFLTDTDYQVTDSGGGIVRNGTFQPGETIWFVGVGLGIDGQPVAGDTFRIEASRTQDVFTTVLNVVQALEAPLGSPAQRAGAQNELNLSLIDLDQAMAHISDMRSSVGARLSVVDNQLQSNESFAFELERTLSSVRDLDYAEAISLLERQLIGLEAAQQSFARLRELSLFNQL